MKAGPVALAGLALLSLACNRSGDAPAPAGSAPACARPSASIAWPAGIPAPSGAVATSVEPWAEGRMLRGVVPGTLRDVATALVRDLPGAGFRVIESEIEGGDAEVEYEGKTARGTIALRPAAACPGAIEVKITATR